VINIEQPDPVWEGYHGETPCVQCFGGAAWFLTTRQRAMWSSARLSAAAARELNERVVNALKDLHRLLELYAPSWYTEELHKKNAAALRAK